MRGGPHPVRGRRHRRRRRLRPHGGPAGRHAAAPGPRSGQRAGQPAQRAARRTGIVNVVGDHATHPRPLRRAAAVRHRRDRRKRSRAWVRHSASHRPTSAPTRGRRRGRRPPRPGGHARAAGRRQLGPRARRAARGPMPAPAPLADAEALRAAADALRLGRAVPCCSSAVTPPAPTASPPRTGSPPPPAPGCSSRPSRPAWSAVRVWPRSSGSPTSPTWPPPARRRPPPRAAWAPAPPSPSSATPARSGDLVPDGCAVHAASTGPGDGRRGAGGTRRPARARAAAAATGAGRAPGAAQRGADGVERRGRRRRRAAARGRDRRRRGDHLRADACPHATAGAPRHDWLTLTGGAIGYGLPAATGAAVACPDRPVWCLQADGSAMYTISALWTHAREGLDVTTVVYNNAPTRSCAGAGRGRRRRGRAAAAARRCSTSTAPARLRRARDAAWACRPSGPTTAEELADGAAERGRRARAAPRGGDGAPRSSEAAAPRRRNPFACACVTGMHGRCSDRSARADCSERRCTVMALVTPDADGSPLVAGHATLHRSATGPPGAPAGPRGRTVVEA